MLAELFPVGAVESMLAERVISLWWRLQRAERMQNQAIDEFIEDKITSPSARHNRECYYYNQGIRPGDPRFDLDHLPLGRIATSDWSNCRVLDLMMLYERRIENSMIKIMKELKRFQIMRRIEQQDIKKQYEPSPSLRDEDATRCAPAEKQVDLKKQSQYAPALMGVTPCMKRDYDNKPVQGIEENKAKQSQYISVPCSAFSGQRRKMLITRAQHAKDLTSVVLGRRIRSKFCFVRKLSMAAIKPSISVEYAGNATIMRFTDEKILEEQDIQALQESIMSVIEQAERINLILDFGNVRFLSSAVLGLLIRVSKRIYERDGQLGLCNINPKIYEIFKITRLTKTFDIYNDIESATEGLSGPN